MKSIVATIKRFLTAEEIPRWFGLSVILIYLVGLGSVTHFGIVLARKENVDYFHQSGGYAIRLLANRLEATSTGRVEEGGGELRAALYRRELSEFGEHFSVDELRVVDELGIVIASMQSNEVGRKHPSDLSGGRIQRAATNSLNDGTVEAGVAQRLERVAIRSSGGGKQFRREFAQATAPVERQAAEPGDGAAVDGSDATGEPDTFLFLEARLSSQPNAGASISNNARVMAVILVVLGALFVVYRCLRGQMRGVARIAEQLTLHRDRLEEELESLRITDTVDTVTASWNDFVALTQGLVRTVERSEADKELSRALQKSGSGALAEALDCVPDGIIYVTDEVQFEYANTAALRLLNWDRGADGSRIEKTLPDARSEGIGAKVLDLMRGSLQGDGTFRTCTEVLQEDDDGTDSSCYRVRVIALPHAQRSGECIVVIRDVSQHIRAERSREEFITQVTHELRTPLTNIRAYAETLSSGMFDDPAVVTECYNVITKETRRLSRLIEDMLSVSQLDVGTIELQFDEVDLKTLLSEGVRDVRGLAEEKNIDLQLALPAKLETLRADRDKLMVVINNLLGNAIKYTQANGNIVVGCQCASEEIAITIKDNGIGIDASEHGRVFEKFQRSQDPAVKNETGTGIGLYTAREIVRHHHGDIDLISEKGQGSTFIVRLPRQATRATSLTTAEET